MSDPISSVAAQPAAVATKPIAPETKKPEETTGTVASAPALAAEPIAKKEEAPESSAAGAGVAQGTLAPTEGKKLYIVA